MQKFFVISALFLTTLLTGCTRTNTEVIRLNYSLFFPPTHIQSVRAAEWAKEIEKRSNGRVEIKLFYSGSLTKAEQCYSGVIDGVSDIGMSSFAYTRGRFPLLEGLDLPVGYKDGITATRIVNEMCRKYNPKEIQNTHILYLHAHGPGVLASRSKIESLQEIQGIACRATGLSTKIVSHLGGNAIGMPQNDTYEALQKGVVQATLCPIETLKGWKQGEVINYVTETPAIGYTTTMFVAMNLERWNSLPEEIKQIFNEVSAEWIDKHGAGWNKADDDSRAMLAEMGKPCIKLSEAETEKWHKLIEPVLEEFIIKTEAKGLPGRSFINDLKELTKH